MESLTTSSTDAMDPTGNPADMAAAAVAERKAALSADLAARANISMEQASAAIDKAVTALTPDVEREPDRWFTIPNRQAKRKFRQALRAMRRKVARDYDQRFRPSGLKSKPDPLDAHVLDA